MTEEPARMTKGERTELLQLIRKRERVMVEAAGERSAALLAEFESQCAAIYSFDDDAVWKKAVDEAKAAVDAARETIAQRCDELGIPNEFAPVISIGWHGRGQNALTERRDELRRAAKARIAAIEKDAVARIGRMSLEAQTQLLSQGLATEAAQSFLRDLASVETLMPAISAVEVKAVVDAKKAERRGGYYGYGD